MDLAVSLKWDEGKNEGRGERRRRELAKDKEG